ncbi:MAG: DNA repair protein RadC [Prevotellaceae bacterium]|jgi:DNA repair protein RadC|nr:DNA repair protein RadC [Prevotellaceae bacterium]
MAETNLTIKDWAEDDRPREKLRDKGAQQLSNAELLAILLGSGTKTETAVDVAKRVLAIAKNDLKELGKKTLTNFMQVKGIGEARAITIMAALELGRRRRSEKREEPDKITGATDVAELFISLLGDLPHEEFWVLFLNRSNKIIEKRKVGQGGLSATVVDSRLIAKLAINNLASGVIVAHNHPSGNLQPSASDKQITEKLHEALALFDINLIDHIIVSTDSYYSFAEEGLL